MLENTRFDPRETANDPSFAEELANGRDLFVEDAFGSVHRAHASTVAVARLLPAYAGLLLEQELRHLGALLGEVARPFVIVCGGAKADDKLPVIRHLGARADEVLLGGKLAEKLRVSNPLDFPVRLPRDVVGVPRLAPDAESLVCAPEELPYGWTVLDIGPKTGSAFAEVIAGAATIFWNGPMGLFEWPRFAGGTEVVARAVAASTAFSVVGGADTVHALNGLGLGSRLLGIDGRRGSPQAARRKGAARCRSHPPGVSPGRSFCCGTARASGTRADSLQAGLTSACLLSERRRRCVPASCSSRPGSCRMSRIRRC